MTDDPPEVGRLTQAALRARSAAYQWLWANRDEIREVIAQHPKPPWLALAKIAAAEEGKVFTADTLRKTWMRVVRDLRREAFHRPAQPPTKAGEGETDDPFGFKLGVSVPRDER